jgi:hypothetical protein
MGAEHFWIKRTTEVVAKLDCIARTTYLFPRTSVADDRPGLGVSAHMDGRHGFGEGWIFAKFSTCARAARHLAARLMADPASA